MKDNLNLGLIQGDKITVISKKNKSNQLIRKEYEVISEAAKFITVSTGSYIVTIDKFDIQTGKNKIIKDGKELLKMREQKITKEQLLADCRKHGTSKISEEIIAKMHGMTQLTIRTYINKWGIKQLLLNDVSKDNINAPESGEVVGEPVPVSQEQVIVDKTTDKEYITPIGKLPKPVIDAMDIYPMMISENKSPILVTKKITFNMDMGGVVANYRISNGKLYIERTDAKPGHPLRVECSELDGYIEELLEVREQWKKRGMSIEY